MRFLVVKQRLSTTADTAFAGGQHIVRCIARTLHEAGHEVHLLTCGSREQVLQSLMLQGTLSSIKHEATPGVLSYADGGGYTVHVACPVDTQHQLSSGSHFKPLPSHHHQQQEGQVSLKGGANAHAALPADVAAVLRHAQHLSRADGASSSTYTSAAAAAASAGGGGGQAVRSTGACSPRPSIGRGSTGSRGQLAVILDMDGCSAALFCGLVQLGPARVFALVQNIHFLPFGPLGCATRDPCIDSQWQHLAGTICVSQYVADYVTRHGPQEAVAAPGAVRVVYNRAWGAWGAGPWRDWGSQHQQQLFGGGGDSSSSGRQEPSCEDATAAAASSGQEAYEQTAAGTPAAAAAAGTPGCQRPVVGMLKVTPEKGAAVLAALAARLTQFDFLGVCGDPGVTAALQRKALPNLQLVEPVSDVDLLLQRVHVVVVPSIWCEAFGMVVVDALLRGIPVLASDIGGLPEAALGAAQLLPIAGIQLPLVAAGAAGSGAGAGAGAAAVGGPLEGHAACQGARHGSGESAGSGGAEQLGSRVCLAAAAPQWSEPQWSQRVLPGAQQQPVATWAACLANLLTDAQAYAAASKAGRAAATAWIAGGAQELQSMVEWMQHKLELLAE